MARHDNHDDSLYSDDDDDGGEDANNLLSRPGTRPGADRWNSLRLLVTGGFCPPKIQHHAKSQLLGTKGRLRLPPLFPGGDDGTMIPGRSEDTAAATPLRPNTSDRASAKGDYSSHFARRRREADDNGAAPATDGGVSTWNHRPPDYSSSSSSKNRRAASEVATDVPGRAKGGTPPPPPPPPLQCAEATAAGGWSPAPPDSDHPNNPVATAEEVPRTDPPIGGGLRQEEKSRRRKRRSGRRTIVLDRSTRTYIERFLERSLELILGAVISMRVLRVLHVFSLWSETKVVGQMTMDWARMACLFAFTLVALAMGHSYIIGLPVEKKASTEVENPGQDKQSKVNSL